MRSIFEKYAKLKKFKTVAEQINADGHRTINGSLFTGQSIARILKDKTHLENGTVSQGLWDEVQTILKARKRGENAKRRVAHLCSGLLKCGCGNAMYVPTRSQKYVCNKCLNKIAKEDLEHIVLENLRVAGSEEVQALVQRWSTLTFEQRREVVESTVQYIIADTKKVSLSLFGVR